ncbi:MAG: bifunctional demethylmenaquinone methyltransferase/2-methoxy-6-polyprenyl-1,4-benzoquinol methylase UbiE [Candidatus Eremiobacter antarcticus]|nr:bifunctional demethylmenaquinone methyltransferase/2-methoxy-6-polyprenyl-1,4-benzoquinol methylase UbiE [Candidatus Eremiobacteraeota bacterium]MBC5808007.1 bifunctional demethylmenaquinone methyltransferase/2-methoxy-6-polyprenyl-1,4-benzoquinol methylase UbiE [Candidatus Eremiobacteraeota bacterium]
MDKGSAVRQMFDKIAGRYDLANTVMTAGVDVLWRRRAAACLTVGADAQLLDLCCGTGALTRELARKVPRGRVVGVDFSEAMLAVANRRPRNNIEYRRADVLDLPFPDERFDGATMAFSLRNVVDIPRCLREVARVLKAGGAFVNLEVSKPQSPLLRRGFFAYFFGVVPRLGGMVGGDAAAYRYLPQSLINFPEAPALTELFKNNGFAAASCVPLFGGVAALHVGTAAPRTAPSQAARPSQASAAS